MSENISLKYTVNNQNPYLDAEPYFYGSGSPNAGYFLPIGEDNKSDTEDFKIQQAENNGYSKIKYLDAFKINNKSIAYLEAGTFPLLREVCGLESLGVAAGTHYFCNLKIIYEAEKIVSIIFETYTRSQSDPIYDTSNSTVANLQSTNLYNSVDKNGILYSELKHGGEEFPKRLGFILVGGGGGSGGGGRYDPDKNKKGSSGDYVIPGGGGGGGEIVYGVLDISYEAAKKILNVDTPTELVYCVKVGNGGYYGSHNISNKASSGGHDGSAGSGGYHSVLYVKTADSKITEILKARLGGGGGGATNFTFGSGGAGGQWSDGGLEANEKNIKELAKKYNCIVRGTVSGGKGGHSIPESDTSVTNDKLEFSIYFSNEVPPNQSDYRLSRSYEATSQTYSTGSNTSASIFKTPGGHSFGNGAEVGKKPTKGGGGGCFETSYRSGAGGYFGLYY